MRNSNDSARGGTAHGKHRKDAMKVASLLLASSIADIALGTSVSRGDVVAIDSLTRHDDWINSTAPRREDLRGKVVLVDFWTYTCVNRMRTLPYLRDWSTKYRDDGLVVIGVHSPEFTFEGKRENVVRAALAMLTERMSTTLAMERSGSRGCINSSGNLLRSPIARWRSNFSMRTSRHSLSLSAEPAWLMPSFVEFTRRSSHENPARHRRPRRCDGIRICC